VVILVAIENEQSLLGALLLDAKEFPQVAAQLTEDDFRVDVDRSIWRAMLALHRAGGTIDPVTVRDWCATNGMVIENRYLMELMEITTTAANVLAYCEAVKRDSMRSKLSELGERLQTESATSDPTELCNTARAALDSVAERTAGNGLASFSDVMVSFLDFRAAIELGRKATVSTGLDCLDRVYGGGLVRAGLHILAARPGVGKTALALNIATNVARRQEPALFISLEMSRNQLTPRILARFSGVNSSALACSGKLDETQWTKVAEAGEVLNEMPLTFCDRDNVGLAYIEAAARSVKGLSLLVIDYLGLLPPSNPRQTIYERVSENSRSLKQLALRLDIPVLCLCQLNREAARNQLPTMADLRDSGHLEQDADTVTLLSPKEAECGADTACLRAEVAKNRHGRTGEAFLWFHKGLCAIEGGVVQ
jgi:replicative DNA helicase